MEEPPFEPPPPGMAPPAVEATVSALAGGGEGGGGGGGGGGDDVGEVWGARKFGEEQEDELSNLTDGEYLAIMLGPKNVGLPLLIPLTLIYVLIFLSGVAGNVAVCLVIVKNKSMHTATNYYLFSLAVSDLMILVLGKKGTDARFSY